MRLEFEPERHVYTVDGRPVPFVSRILKESGMQVNYSGVDEAVLERARQRGTHVDLACDMWDEGTLDMASVHEPWRGYVEAWASATTKHTLRVVRTQVMLYHPLHDYAGTADVFALGGNLWIDIDRKTSTKIHRQTYGLQTMAYNCPGILAAEPDGTLVPRTMAVERWIVQLKRDGRFSRYVCADPMDAVDWPAAVRVAKGQGSDEDQALLTARLARYGNGNGRS